MFKRLAHNLTLRITLFATLVVGLASPLVAVDYTIYANVDDPDLKTLPWFIPRLDLIA